MSVFTRARTRLLVCCVACVAALGALVLAPAAGAFNIGGTYLALGDSLAYGYHQAQFEEELAKGSVNPATFNRGYVDDFGGALKLANPHLQVINDGRPARGSSASRPKDAEAGDRPKAHLCAARNPTQAHVCPRDSLVAGH